MKYSILLTAALFSSAAMAADVGGGGGSSANQESGNSSYGSTGSEMRHVRDLLQREKYKAAIQTLRQVVLNDHQNADAWNLLGYSQRKLGNYKKSGKHYAMALKLNPEHKGVLEYQGQLFVTLNDLDRARDNQRRLVVLCPDGCEQLSDLSLAIANAEE